MIYDAHDRPVRRAIGFIRAMTRVCDQTTDAVGSQVVLVEEHEVEECLEKPDER